MRAREKTDVNRPGERALGAAVIPSGVRSQRRTSVPLSAIMTRLMISRLLSTARCMQFGLF